MANVKSPTSQRVRTEEQEIEIFVEYQEFSVLDLADILSHLARAYEVLNGPRFTIDDWKTLSEIGLPVEMYEETLQIASVTTGKSITLLFVGAAAVVLHLAFVTKKVFEARKVYWESENIKWQARQAEHMFEKGMFKEQDDAEKKAATQIKQLFDIIDGASTLTACRFEVGTLLSLEHTKGPETATPSNKRRARS